MGRQPPSVLLAAASGALAGAGRGNMLATRDADAR
jgi:hypothetical protein